MGSSNNKLRIKFLESGRELWLGKDKEQNEKLMKQFMGKSNIIMHTIAPGSPFCVSISEDKLSVDEKKQMAVICAAYSQDWRDTKKDIQVSIFPGKDVYKSKTMPTGTFGVKTSKKVLAKKKDIETFKNEAIQ
jgi:predicted ribosome quality control (RQC) complex YloA/Tae2 family protein